MNQTIVGLVDARKKFVDQTDKYFSDDSNFISHFLSADEWRYYFDISLYAVVRHLLMVIMPFFFPGPWKPKTFNSDVGEYYLPASLSIYACELYTPFVTFFTLVNVLGIVQGLDNTLSPEDLAKFVLVLIVYVMVVSVVAKAMIEYSINIGNDIRDIMFISGMSSVPMLLSELLSLCFPKYFVLVLHIILHMNYFIFCLRWYAGRFSFEKLVDGSSIQQLCFNLSLLHSATTYLIYLLI
ncbi:Protein YIF1 [Entamoeba marina]